MICLDECLSISEKIKEIEDEITELESRTMSPKNQIISDMPKGGGKQVNNIESYLIKLEKLTQKKEDKKRELELWWKITLDEFKKIGVIEEEKISLMKYRYYYGYEWKKCLCEMQSKYENSKWTINRCYYINHSILHKTIE